MLESEKISATGNINKYSEQMANMNAQIYFKFQDPNPVADHADEMISIT